MSEAFFTVGHSNRTLADFVDLLRESEIETVVDVRKFPRSRNNPQFDREELTDALPAAGIGYEHQEALGGRRPKSKAVSLEVNGFWEHPSFHNYADYALSAEFAAAIADLVRRGRDSRSALMCSEAVWWRCHRRIIADHLLARGESVFHILARDRADPAALTAGARAGPDGKVTYPAG